MNPEIAAVSPEIPVPATGAGGDATRAAAWAARIIGLLTLGWVYLAIKDLRWLLHFHAVHALVTKAPLSFSYGPYLALNIVNVAVPVLIAGVLLVFPGSLLRALTPKGGKPRPLSTGWFATGIAFGFIMLVLGLQAILATALWTVYQAGHDEGWQTEISVYTVAAAGGIVLCRGLLAGRREQ